VSSLPADCLPAGREDSEITEEKNRKLLVFV